VTHAHPDSSRIHPPARDVVLCSVSNDPIDAQALAELVSRDGAGAVVTFVGAVRDQDHGRPVTGIEYVGHPTAGRVLEETVAKVAARSEVEAIAVAHRIGTLGIGDAAFVVAVSGVHRREAFETASELVDEVKHHLPVWKRQLLADGTDEWVACP